MAKYLYSERIEHEGLRKSKVIRADDLLTLNRLGQLQHAEWEEAWQAKLAKERAKRKIESLAAEADALTAEAAAAIQAAEGILAHTLNVDDTINWEKLKDKSRFKETLPAKPMERPTPPEPMRPKTELSFFAKLMESLSAARREERIKKEDELYHSWVGEWEAECVRVRQENRATADSWESAYKAVEARRAEHKAKQAAQHASVDEERAQWLAKEPGAIEAYCNLVLMNSSYSEWVPGQAEVQFNGDSGVAIVEFKLPTPQDLPRLKEVKFLKTKQELQEIYLKDADAEKLYDSVCYQIALRTIHELYEADTVAGIAGIVFNGYIESVDPATGQDFRAVIISLNAVRDEFLALDLSKVDPKACVKKMRGLAAPKLTTLTPVAPIARFSTSDCRFIEGKEVLEGIDEGSNLASMDWGDFEHLIRQIFELEFSANGAEVKVTQASKDGGVDAVVFDPDPIRGGKIVIQAKRYNKLVPVSAVRDLYGTVLNEGANKGILVTTAHYGPDAHDFTKDKPLSLINGAELLYLLEKHGRKAHISLTSKP